MWYYTVGGHNWFFVCINSIIYLQSHTHTRTQSGHSGKDRKKKRKTAGVPRLCSALCALQSTESSIIRETLGEPEEGKRISPF